MADQHNGQHGLRTDPEVGDTPRLAEDVSKLPEITSYCVRGVERHAEAADGQVGDGQIGYVTVVRSSQGRVLGKSYQGARIAYDVAEPTDDNEEAGS